MLALFGFQRRNVMSDLLDISLSDNLAYRVVMNNVSYTNGKDKIFPISI